jgi:flavin reductase (DIM6/NTAB) family NADH-FMN oxidoreductase RutF
MTKLSKRVNASQPRQMGVDEDWFGFVPSIPVMISCTDREGRPNIIPIMSWSFACRWPPIVTIGICEVNYTPRYFQRASYQMILDTGEFVVNFPDESMRGAINQTGSLSANDPTVDKFAAAGLSAMAALAVKAPLVAECPINVECVVTGHQSLGSHHLFCGEVVAYHQPGEVVDDRLVDGVQRITYRQAADGHQVQLAWSSLMSKVTRSRE